jgi:ABC-type oligopeptide transport system substrate-binding subunit
MKLLLIALLTSSAFASTAFAEGVKDNQRNLVCWTNGTVPTSLGWERPDGETCVFDVSRNKAIWAKEVH